jgi:hypothetical protein
MSSPPPKLQYRNTAVTETHDVVDGVLHITQPAPDGLTFVAVHLAGLIMLGAVTALLAWLTIVTWRRGELPLLCSTPLGILILAAWAGAVLRMMLAFFRRASPTSLDVTEGTLEFQHPFLAPARQTINNMLRIGVTRQRIALFPLPGWQVRLYSDNLPTPAISIRTTKTPSVPLLWYANRAQADAVATSISDAFNGRVVDPATLTQD